MVLFLLCFSPETLTHTWFSWNNLVQEAATMGFSVHVESKHWVIFHIGNCGAVEDTDWENIFRESSPSFIFTLWSEEPTHTISELKSDLETDSLERVSTSEWVSSFPCTWTFRVFSAISLAPVRRRSNNPGRCLSKHRCWLYLRLIWSSMSKDASHVWLNFELNKRNFIVP